MARIGARPIGRPPAPTEPEPRDIFPAYVAWVEGRAVVRAGNIDRDKRHKMGVLERLLAEVGLHLHTRDVHPGDLPDETEQKARYSKRPMRQGEIMFMIVKKPGLSIPELAEELFKKEPWSNPAQLAAEHRLKVALNKIRKSPEVIKVTYDSDGTRRYYPCREALIFAKMHF